MEIIVNEIIVLKSMPINKGLVKQDFIYRNSNVPDLWENVKNIEGKDYISILDEIYTITETGISYLKQYDLFGIDELTNHRIGECIVKFLGSIDQPINAELFPQSIINSVPSYCKQSKEDDLAQYIQFEDCRKYINTNNVGKFSLNDLGVGYLNSIKKLENEYLLNSKADSQRQQLQDKINTLTLKSLELQDTNSELVIKLSEANLKLSNLQIEDIPVNAMDRKTIITWTIVSAVIAIGAFVLGFFAGKQ
jgi:hypothetical protein